MLRPVFEGNIIRKDVRSWTLGDQRIDRSVVAAGVVLVLAFEVVVVV